MNDIDTQPSEWKIKVRSRIDRNTAAVAIVLVMLVLAGCWLTYTAHFVEPEPVQNEVVTGEWSTNPGFSHEAVVERANPLYPTGDTVSGTPAYYTSIMPVLDATYAFRYSASDNGSLDTVTEANMIIRETDGNGDVYWSRTETVAQVERTDIEPGETVITDIEVNVSEVEEDIDGIRSGLGTSLGSEEVLLEFTTTAEGEVNGESARSVDRNRVVVELGSDVYTVSAVDGSIRGSSFEMTETVEVEPEPDTVLMAASPLLLLISLGLLAGFVVAKRRDVIAPTEQELLAVERLRFDEWISTARVSDSLLSDTEAVVNVESLEGLVDIAIDTEGRVIEDRERGALCILDDTVVYLYNYDDLPTGTADFDKSDTNGDGAEDEIEDVSDGLEQLKE